MKMMEKVNEVVSVGGLDEETIRIVERLVVLRISTKNINLMMR